MRLLLVDDNEMNVELFSDTLEAEGHAVTVERDGAAGLERALDEHFDALILDIQLPHLDGNELCTRLRAAGLDQPIIALSSAAMPEQVERGRKAGFTAYLTKPITPAVLRGAIRRLGTST